jgi:hypothetical protein
MDVSVAWRPVRYEHVPMNNARTSVRAPVSIVAGVRTTGPQSVAYFKTTLSRTMSPA